MSYAGLVLDRHRAGGREELLDQVVLLRIERRPTQEVQTKRPLERLTVLGLLLPRLLAGPDDPVGDHLGRPLKRDVLPVASARPAVLHPGLPHRRVDELLGGGTLRAEPAAG